MTPAETLVARTTAASGVPEQLEDPATIARLAALLARKKAAPVTHTPGTAREARRVRGEHPTAA